MFYVTFLNNPAACIKAIGMVTETRNAYKVLREYIILYYIILYYIIYIVCLLNISATLVAILKEVHYKGILQNFFQTIH